ncbi:hypothetical protein CC85DRAFT_311953 [Cutaneotrichosporon oleaginosum]|uniref:Uncharacterized protein n=1 Tax=Cutaneotrichosporon oleaginosum TaxID=879819 RepID=A0A0J0XPJ0_9TREE|nr:uncharacterized protein CC85DRAFT_311953 [Cutaneotrichosporon oleaginosum]KLT43013.1 hypothetical protein CC85DRAFT_311953 [Cutaneotrichosporon oleaginosum]TXT11783.1 hypothetical protein COLE_02193 [Cutaneotrichosporon oleaginosum]
MLPRLRRRRKSIPVRPVVLLTDPAIYHYRSDLYPRRPCPYPTNKMTMDVDDCPSPLITLPAISVASPSPSKRPAPLKLQHKDTPLPSIGDLFEGVNIKTPFSPFARLARNHFNGDLPALSPFPPLRSPLSVPSLSLQPATPLAGQNTTADATYVPTEQLVNNDFEIDPSLAETEASTPLNTPPDMPLPAMAIIPGRSPLRCGNVSSARNVLVDASPGRSYSSQAPSSWPYRTMNNGWDTQSIAPRQIGGSPSPAPESVYDEPVGPMELEPQANTWAPADVPRTGYFAPRAPADDYTRLLAPKDGFFPTPAPTPPVQNAWAGGAPCTPPNQRRALPAYVHSAPTYIPTPYASPSPERALYHTVPPGATFEQWSSAGYNLAAPWSEGHARTASPAFSERSMDPSPSLSRAHLYDNAYAYAGPSSYAGPSGTSTSAGTSAGPMRPGTVHGRARHTPVPRKRSTTGVALNQFAQLTSNLIYPSYPGAIRQWAPVVIDPATPVPPEYRDKRGFWEDDTFWTWDSTIKTHMRCLRICAQCHCDRPGAKTWRRSHIQQDTSVCFLPPKRQR